LRQARIQARLKISQPDDPFEREADAVAARIVETSDRPGAAPTGWEAELDSTSDAGTGMLQRLCNECEEELQRKASVGDSGLRQVDAPTYQAFSSGGQALPDATRAEFGRHLGADLSQVRVHRDAQAVQAAERINARAFTLGRHIVFGRNEYDPAGSRGRFLLAHELVHTLQQTGSTLHRLGDVNQLPENFPCGNPTPAPPSNQHVLFENNSVAITEPGRERITDFVGDWRRAGGNAAVRVDGYASQPGGDPHNWTLSCQRSAAVVAELERQGIPTNLIEQRAQGETAEFGAEADNRRASLHMETVVPPRPEPPPPPAPVRDPPTIPVTSCACPAPTASCLPGYCVGVPTPLAIAERSQLAPGIITTLSALGGLEVGAIYYLFVWGGVSGVMTLSSSLSSEFASVCQTAMATNHLMSSLVRAIWGRYNNATPAQTIPLSSLIPTPMADIGTPGNPHELVYCGSTNAPGLLAGGIGTTQLAIRVGAIPSGQNDSRSASGQVRVTRVLLPGGGVRLEFTPSIDIEVRDTVDFCPGNCGGLLAQGATNPLSRWEASGISGDVPFVTTFPAPPAQLRRIVLESVNGVDRWSLETV
jgi:hypothetical protein